MDLEAVLWTILILAWFLLLLVLCFVQPLVGLALIAFTAFLTR